MFARDRYARKHSRCRDRDARIERRLPQRGLDRQIHRRLSQICRQRRAEIHRRRVEGDFFAERFRRLEHLRAAILRGCVREGAGLRRSAFSGLVPAHEFRLAQGRPGDGLLGAAALGENLEH